MPPEVLVATAVKDGSKWLDKFLANFKEINYPRDKLHFAFVEGNSSDDSYERLIAFKKEHNNVWLQKFDIQTENRFERLAKSRNKIFDEALDKEEYVLSIDADIVFFHPNFLNLMIKHDVDVVAPLILIEDENRFYDTLAFRCQGRNFEHEIPYFPLCVHRKLFEVESVGTCYLAKRAVFDAEVRYAGGISEQVTFCARARERGFKIWVDPTVAVIHANLPKYGVDFH